MLRLTAAIGVLVACVGFSIPAMGNLVSAVLPSSRAVTVDATATVFATVISAAQQSVSNCQIALSDPGALTFAYQATDPATNQPVGELSPAFQLNPGQVATFVLSITSQTEMQPTRLVFDFACDGAAAAVVPGVNTLDFSASNTPGPDVVALAATVNSDGVTHLPQDRGFGFFSVATVNVGVQGVVEITPRATHGGLPIEQLLVCETDVLGSCLAPPQASGLTTDMGAGATHTFAVFVSNGPDIDFDPADNRVFLEFTQTGGGPSLLKGATSVAMTGGGDSQPFARRGVPNLLSPHSTPIVANAGLIYVVNTPADTVDVIDAQSMRLVDRVNVGVDPVGLAVRPDGEELWVVNHVSDAISVVDLNPSRRSYHQVIATIQDVDPVTLATRFDEPVGIAFADNSKAYVTLSVANEVAVINADTRELTGRLNIRAQDPRALTVNNGRLYVAAFESNNQTQLSGCRSFAIDGVNCTFDAVEHVFTNNNVLSLNYDADIVKNTGLPDRDVFVYDTTSDQQIDIINGVGTLLYGIAATSNGHLYVSQADARNHINGRAGTDKHGLAEMQNRAFLNQITRVDCTDTCGAPQRVELEPLPPSSVDPGQALATPYAVSISDDDAYLFATAASSNKLFVLDLENHVVLHQVQVGGVPRGIYLETQMQRAWVFNAGDNSISVVDVSAPGAMEVAQTLQLDDPTDAQMKAGRLAFNDALASTSGTFSCESCHPDGHTDQLLWVLDTPICDVDGCTQIPPRVTMPVRGLRDTAPYHWDGIPGDPYGGINTASINAPVAANCDPADERSCTRHLVDGSLATTMCEVGACPTNQSGQAGALDEQARDALAHFILNLPYPPAPGRGLDNSLTQAAQDGFFEFNFTNDSGGNATGAQTCGACHKMPYFVSTNTPGTGMDAPTWRGAYDRWMLLPQGRLNIIDLLRLVGMDDSFPERALWILAGASPDIWEMVRSIGTGFHGAFARQLTLNAAAMTAPSTLNSLEILERAAAAGAVELQGWGLLTQEGVTQRIGVEYLDGQYELQFDANSLDPGQLREMATAGDLTLALTAYPPAQVSGPQPSLYPSGELQTQVREVTLPQLNESGVLQIQGRHLDADMSLNLNGQPVAGSVTCVSGTWPACDDDQVQVTFAEPLSQGGVQYLQLQNKEGLFSNDLLFYDPIAPLPPRPGNLITSGGLFTPGQFENNWNTVELAATSIASVAGELRVNVQQPSAQPWHVQISHAVWVAANQQYTLCFRAKAQGSRFITAYVDSNLDSYTNLSQGQFRADLTTQYQQFQHTFTSGVLDLHARVAFDMAQSALDVQLDDIGLYEGSSCGSP